MSEKACFGAGCFWGVEHLFKQQIGVLKTEVGYMGGDIENPSYRQVCTGSTGHAEVVEIEFDPNQFSFEALIDLFFRLHDPTQLNRQGPDVGTQYRSAIFYYNKEQKRLGENKIKSWQEKFQKPIETTLEAAATFYPAEDYHQDFYDKNPGRPICHILHDW